MNILLVFPFNENNNKPKTVQATILYLWLLCVFLYLFSLNQNYRENSFLFQQENLRETTKALKIYMSSSERTDLLLNCL